MVWIWPRGQSEFDTPALDLYCFKSRNKSQSTTIIITSLSDSDCGSCVLTKFGAVGESQICLEYSSD